MAQHPKFSEVEGPIYKGIENLDKWYNKVNDTDAYFICLFLDPNIKNAYALDKWDAKSYTAGMAQLEKVGLNNFQFDAYYVTPAQELSVPITSSSCNVSSTQYGYSWMRASVRSHQEAEHFSSGPRDELKRYLDSPLEEVDGVVAWWGVTSLLPISYPFEYGP
ncbi:hypothetical protein BYT27DRAFT_7209063 [Phlegmacium glaucopus]|nr:hypothetical protein BYT27DRAFT_7209063 [Phlegmacium glaucopus]